jgi:REP element-mobilizing transposase RayT
VRHRRKRRKNAHGETPARSRQNLGACEVKDCIPEYNILMDRYCFVEGVYVYFVTFTIIDWLPIFISPEPIKTIVDSLKYCVSEKGLRINAYVVMPNHIHLIVFDANLNNENLYQTLTSFRKFTGHKLAQFIDMNLARSISSAIRNISLEDRERRIWQSGWHAEAITSETFWKQKIDYIHMNPVKKCLVREPEYWQYSSAGFWLTGKEGELPVSHILEEM